MKIRTYTIDASVAVKWIFPSRPEESHTTQALSLLQSLKYGNQVIQPPHWIAETTAVVVRLEPNIAKEASGLLISLQFPTLDNLELYRLACTLSARYNHHLFDTLYHAVAILRDAQFVTADEKYYKKAYKEKSIILLEDLFL